MFVVGSAAPSGIEGETGGEQGDEKGRILDAHSVVYGWKQGHITELSNCFANFDRVVALGWLVSDALTSTLVIWGGGSIYTYTEGSINGLGPWPTLGQRPVLYKHHTTTAVPTNNSPFEGHTRNSILLGVQISGGLTPSHDDTRLTTVISPYHLK